MNEPNAEEIDKGLRFADEWDVLSDEWKSRQELARRVSEILAEYRKRKVLSWERGGVAVTLKLTVTWNVREWNQYPSSSDTK